MSVDGGRGEAKGATENVHSFVTSLCGGLPQDNSDPEQFLFIKNFKLRGAGQEKRFLEGLCRINLYACITILSFTLKVKDKIVKFTCL